MLHTLTLEVPEDVYETLVKVAELTGRTPKEVTVEWLAIAVKRLAVDRSLQSGGENK